MMDKDRHYNITFQSKMNQAHGQRDSTQITRTFTTEAIQVATKKACSTS